MGWKSKSAIAAAVLMLAGAGSSANACPGLAQTTAAPSDVSSQANTTRTPRATPKKMKKQKTKKARPATQPKSTNQ